MRQESIINRLLISLATAGLGVASVPAEEVTYQFTGATATGDGATALVTSNNFGNGVVASVFTLVDGNSSGVFVDGFHRDRAEVVLKGVPTTWTFAITIPSGVTVNLTQLDFIDGIRWVNSRPNTTYSGWSFAIDNGGTATPSQVTNERTSEENVGEQQNSRSLSLSGLTGLTDTTVTFTITGQFGINPDLSGGNDQTRQTFIDDITLTGTVGANLPFQVTITPNASNPGNYDFSWPGDATKVYDLVSELDLENSSDPITWSVWESQSGIPGVSPITSVTNIPGGSDPARFFSVIERNP